MMRGMDGLLNGRQRWWRALLLLAALLAALLGVARAGSCAAVACVSAGPRLVSVNSAQSAILNPLIGGLLGGNVTLSVLDWNAVAATDLRLGLFLDALRVQAGVATVEGALTTGMSVAGVLEAAAVAAEADGNTAGAGALRALKAQVAGLTGTVALGDLLKLNFPSGAFADARINALNLVTGGAQLFNQRNAVTTGSSPVTLNGVSVNLSGLGLGVGAATPTVQLFVQVVEPPVYVCGEQGSTFHTAAVRVKLNVNLNGLTVNVLGLPGATIALTNLTLYLEVARATGTLDLVNAVSQALTLKATPGLARLGLGQISDAVFFDRGRTAPMTLPAYAKIGAVTANLGLVLGTVNLDVEARSLADGTYPLESVSAAPPYPQAVTVGSSSAAIPTLVGTLVTNLDVRLTPAPLQAVLDVLLAPVKTTVGTALQPTLVAVLQASVDQVLRLLGIGIGEAVFTVNSVSNGCRVTARVYRDAEPDGAPGAAETWDGPGTRVNLVSGASARQSVAVPAGAGTAELGVPEGTHTLIVAGGAAGVAAQAPAGWVFVNPVGGSVTLTVAAGTASVTDPTFGLFEGDRVDGTLFRDDGFGGGAAHDAAAQPSEPRVAGRSVTVTGSGGARSATTAADGSFTLFVPGGWTGVTLDFTGAETVTGVRVGGAATLATDALGSGVRPAALPVPAGAARVVTLGFTGRPSLSPDRSGRSIAPGTLRYLHVLNPGSVGALSFTKTGAFGRAFYLDSDCDGVVGAAERTPLTTVTVGDSWPRAADGTLRSCALEVEVSVPANAASGTTEAATVTAQLAWAGSAVTDSAAVTDTTTVSPPAAITKTVENLTGAPGVVGTAALARPGDRLRYCLNVTNPALDSVTDLTVSDTLTGAAGYEPGSLTLDGVALSDAADTDAGSVSGRTVTVTLATLAAGQTRQVCFEVTVP